jgi:hypothetical protein
MITIHSISTLQSLHAARTWFTKRRRNAMQHYLPVNTGCYRSTEDWQESHHTKTGVKQVLARARVVLGVDQKKYTAKNPAAL